ncbi:MAG: hypothetical protein B7Y25_08370 [Alphaproteobacteria bacterium 16-39-46]|nr:MAG: hypothetical protein B7Y25_08370 [Alphaproteobacteria bacterium 16-39-46]OZA41104.1 MAG: hypothetical protein B7X84_08570 [Alphaproteobacteria bacterium 17-39-52]
MVLVGVQFSSVHSLPQENERLPEDVASKIRAIFVQHGTLMMPVNKMGDPTRDEIRSLGFLRPRISEYWRSIQSDILRGGTTTEWLTALNKYGVIDASDIEKAKGPYISFCASLKERKFFGQYDPSKRCNPRDFIFKSPEFLRRLIGEVARPDLTPIINMYFPLVVQEWMDVQFLKSNQLKKSLSEIIEILSSEEQINWLFKQSYIIYWKWCVNRFLENEKEKKSPRFRDLPQEVQEIFGTQIAFSNGCSLKDDIQHFLEKSTQILKVRDSVEDFRQKAYQLGFYQQFEFFENLEKIVVAQTQMLSTIQRNFLKAVEAGDDSSLEGFCETMEIFNQTMTRMVGSLRVLKQFFQKKPEAQAEGGGRASFSVAAFEEILRQEISPFSPDNLGLYHASIRDFYLLGWPSVQSDFMHDLPLSIEKSAFSFQNGKMLTMRGKFQGQIFGLEEELSQKKEREVQYQAQFEELEKAKGILICAQERLEQSVAAQQKEIERHVISSRERALEEERQGKKPLEARLKIELITYQESLKKATENLEKAEQELKKLKEKFVSSEGEYKSTLKSLRAEEVKVKAEMEKLKTSFDTRLAFELENGKRSLRQEYDAKILDFTKKHQEALEALKSQLKDLSLEKEDAKRQETAILGDCQRLFQREFSESLSWKTLKEAISSLKLEIDQLKLQNKTLLSREETQQGSLRERLTREAQQVLQTEREKWKIEREKMTGEFQKKTEEMKIETQKERDEKQKREEVFGKSAQDWIEEKERMVREFQERTVANEERIRTAEDRAADYRAESCANLNRVIHMEAAYQTQLAALRAEIAYLQQQISAYPSPLYEPQYGPQMVLMSVPAAVPYSDAYYHQGQSAQAAPRGRGEKGKRGVHYAGSYHQ